jgi:molybdopterin molybdotransferase
MTKQPSQQPSLSQLASDPSCMDDYDPSALSVEQARRFIKQFLIPVSETETVPIRASLGRTLAESIVSPCNVPNHNNSAMDGYAYQFSEGVKIIKIVGTAFAGKPFEGEINAGECIKIMTGAVVPKNLDTVVMQEKVVKKSDCITLLDAPQQGANVRLAGEDLTIGQTVLAKGHIMQPADLGLIASLGIAKITCYRRLKVAFFSTGDELISVGKPLKEGEIYDSNRYTLFGMLSKLGVKISDLGVVPDDLKRLKKTLLEATATHDVVITSGGVSVGEADYMKTLLSRHGEVLFWKINMKPGRPLAYGKIGSAHYFGLPGNPVSTMVTFYQFVRNALLLLSGSELKALPSFKVECTAPIKKSTGRTEFQRGILYAEDDGIWKVKPTGKQGSGILSSMSAADCFIVLDETMGNCDAGTMVNVQLLKGIV